MFSKHARFSKLAVCLLVLSHFVACSGGRKTVTDESTLKTTGTSTGTTLGTSTGSTLGTGTGAGSIFDQDLSAQETTAGAGSSSLLPTASQQEDACLTTNSALGLGSGGYGNYSDVRKATAGSSSSTAQSYACLGGGLQSGQSLDSNSIYQATADSYAGIDDCIGRVLNIAPDPDASEEELHATWRLAQLSLSRCYRNLLQAQYQYLPWNDQVGGAYRDNIGELFKISVFVGNRRY